MIPLLQLENVTKSFGAVKALRGVSFELLAGEVHALLGENGAGKSTLIKIITGAHSLDGGTLRWDGEMVTGLTPARALKRGIACIYQQPALFPDLSVAENLALRWEPIRVWRGVNWRSRRARAVELLARVGAEVDPDAEVRALALPEQQLVEIAAAVGAGAKLVIMDEPTAALTAREQARLFTLVRELRREGAGIIYISHRLEEIITLADRVTVLRDGASVVTRQVQGANSTSARVKDSASPPLTEAMLIHWMVGREVTLGTRNPATPQPPSRAAALELRLVACASAGVPPTSLKVQVGEIVGLGGLVGAGRTELARVIFGVTPAEAGEIQIGGKTVAISSPEMAIREGLGYLPEDRRRHGLILEMPIAANVTMAAHSRLFPWTWFRARVERQVTEELIARLGIKAAGLSALGNSLSGGNQQKVALARWLVTKPRVLILDEPTQGVDVGAKAEIHRLIRELASSGLAVLLISSDLPELLALSDRVLVLRDGRVVGEFPGGSAPTEIMAAALGQKASETGRGKGKDKGEGAGRSW